MSRIGKAPIKIPAGVELKVNGNVFTVKGPKGELSQTFDPANIELCVENGEIIVKRFNEENATKAKHGLYRALAYNMVVGVTEGYKKTLIVNGVGWKVAQNCKDVSLSVGLLTAVDTISASVIIVISPHFICNLDFSFARPLKAISKCL